VLEQLVKVTEPFNEGLGINGIMIGVSPSRKAVKCGRYQVILPVLGHTHDTVCPSYVDPGCSIYLALLTDSELRNSCSGFAGLVSPSRLMFCILDTRYLGILACK